MKQHTFDCIIIGSGAGGGTLAGELASSGMEILILEQGDFLPREKENWDPKALFVEERYNPKEIWFDHTGKPFSPSTHYYVGGNTKVYGAALFRLRERDFQEVKHYGGLSPAWPLSYADFQPYYLRAEQRYEVHGTRGEDPYDPPETHPYPFPALVHEPKIDALARHFQCQGLRPFHIPLGVRRNDQDPAHSLCIRCDTCDGFPCLVDAKSDAQHMGIEPALKHPNVHLWTQAKAMRILTDASGKRATEVELERHGETLRVRGRLIVVAGGAIHSAALLLRSKSVQHPNGLANSSDLVGRHYMCHLNSAVLAFSREYNDVIFQKTLALNDFYEQAPDSTLPLGHIQLLGKVKGPMLSGDAPSCVPMSALNFMAHHAVGWWLTSEDLPDPSNRVIVDAQGAIHLHYKPNNEEAHRRLYAKLKEILRPMPRSPLGRTWFYLGKQIPLPGVAHQVGTCRFGTDPRTSVLDLNCKAHDLENLYVVDGSFFPSSAAVNPGLTIIANAIRVADILLAVLS